jgi:hypothetical protein
MISPILILSTPRGGEGLNHCYIGPSGADIDSVRINGLDKRLRCAIENRSRRMFNGDPAIGHIMELPDSESPAVARYVVQQHSARKGWEILACLADASLWTNGQRIEVMSLLKELLLNEVDDLVRQDINWSQSTIQGVIERPEVVEWAARFPKINYGQLSMPTAAPPNAKGDSAPTRRRSMIRWALILMTTMVCSLTIKSCVRDDRQTNRIEEVPDNQAPASLDTLSPLDTLYHEVQTHLSETQGSRENFIEFVEKRLRRNFSERSWSEDEINSWLTGKTHDGYLFLNLAGGYAGKGEVKLRELLAQWIWRSKRDGVPNFEQTLEARGRILSDAKNWYEMMRAHASLLENNPMLNNLEGFSSERDFLKGILRKYPDLKPIENRLRDSLPFFDSDDLEMLSLLDEIRESANKKLELRIGSIKDISGSKVLNNKLQGYFSVLLRNHAQHDDNAKILDNFKSFY